MRRFLAAPSTRCLPLDTGLTGHSFCLLRTTDHPDLWPRRQRQNSVKRIDGHLSDSDRCPVGHARGASLGNRVYANVGCAPLDGCAPCVHTVWVAVLLCRIADGGAIAVVGAIVAEFNGAEWGVGKDIFIAAKRLEPELMMFGIISGSVLAALLYGIVVFGEQQLSDWYRVKGE